KDYAAQLQDLEESTRLNPRDPMAFNSLAWMRATCLDPRFRDGKKAVAAATVAMQLTGNKEGFYMDTLAAAYAEAGNFKEAVRWQQQALRDPAYAAEYASEGQMRLRLFQAAQAFRE